MSLKPFALVTPSTRGLSAALTRRLLAKSDLPVYATYRQGDPERVKGELLRSLDDVDPSRLNKIHLDLEDEQSIRSAAEKLDETLPPGSYLHTGFFTGGVLLNPEKQPGDINLATVQKTFKVNVFSHLFLMKHFARFLPSALMSSSLSDRPLAKWIHITARVGSIGENNKGGWYSYRTSKAALNQAMHTFDLHLKQTKRPAMAVGIHPGTMKTELSRGFWKSAPKDRLREPEEAAEHVLSVVERLEEDQRGRVWDWAGKEIVW
ncbi:NAD(P)-binding protein [Thelephora ganbajun]|uniref:NAD(P)-binding protein n=1 Tax=Thelephora ganbajun TaxID=370292 RepID=A0ACB6ZBK3_THEGA|nr:NAD(P)-binding protein [Thelephora ganbajun]